MELFPFVSFGMHTFFIGEHSILLQNRRLCTPTSRRLADTKPVGLCEPVNLFRIHAVSECSLYPYVYKDINILLNCFITLCTPKW